MSVLWQGHGGGVKTGKRKERKKEEERLSVRRFLAM
jgi:hypothetical protein